MQGLFSSQWYRVAGLHPRLRGHVRVSRHVYRAQVWYLLQDQSTGRNHRVDETAFHFIGRMDGRRSSDEIWHALLGQLGERAPTQDESIELLCQLSDHELLQCEITPDVAELFRRRFRNASRRRLAMLNPLSFRVPLFDPDSLLNRLAPLGRLVFRPGMLLVWMAIVLLGALAAASNWSEILAFARVNMLTPRYLLLLWVCYPLVKAVHEIAHGLAVKTWGGEVRETGISVMLLMPVPYVDASSASAFPERHRRAAVAGAGIMAELLLAALAAILWLNVEDGVVRDCAFVVMFIGSVSTVLFNGNPLLRFDGYYVLSDVLDMPNLAPRANAWVAHLAQRRLLRVQSQPPPTARGEPALLLGYAVTAYAYRWFVAGVIVLWSGHYSFWLGLLAAAFVVFAMVAKPAVRLLEYLRKAPQLALARTRAYGVTAGISVAALVILFALPVPFSTTAEGVVWQPEDARIRAGTSGFVSEVLVGDGQPVGAGEALLVLEDPELQAQYATAVARVQALEVEQTRAMGVDTPLAHSLQQELAALRSEAEDLQRRLEDLVVVSPVSGMLVLPRPQDLPGSYVARGDVLAHVLHAEDISVKVAVPQADAGLIQGNTRSVEVSLVERAGAREPAHLSGAVPAATAMLPTAALGTRAGGSVPVDPADDAGLRTLEPVFLIDVKLDARRLERVGARAWVRFDHGARPVAMQWQRRLHQLFLKQFNPTA